MSKVIIAALAIVLASGCSTIPDVTYHYYPTAWKTSVALAQTLGCSKDKNRLVIQNGIANVTTNYFSDRDQKPSSFTIRSLHRWFSDNDFAMNLTDDGRLKSINQSTAGQGEAIVKATVTLAMTAGGMSPSPPGAIPVCDDIEAAGEGKPVTLNYKGTVDSTKVGQSFNLDVAPESADLQGKIARKYPLPQLIATVSKTTDLESGASSVVSMDASVVPLKLQKTGYIDLSFKADSAEIGGARIVVPENCGEACFYSLPIPKAALFGKQTFALTLAESGAISSVAYGSLTGAPGALNSLGSLLTPETAAQRANDLKAQSDLIAQQTRSVLCKTKPDECK